MINNIHIQDYKSIVDLKLTLSNFNVLIGANGCGKSNILEAIALAAAASSNKLDYEYFANRGIRVTDEKLMVPAFDDINAKNISIIVRNSNKDIYTCKLRYNIEAKPPMWENEALNLEQLFLLSFNDAKAKQKNKEQKVKVKLSNMIEALVNLEKERGNDIVVNIKINNKNMSFSQPVPELNRFTIYSLEESRLRQANNDNRVFPLGRNGEGLFTYLKDVSNRDNGLQILKEIKDNLKVFDWFEDLSVPQGQLSTESKIIISDTYISETLSSFDQRSTNEGFLYLLFYLTLIISDETPTFFAIENIDTGFNPKLCKKVISHLIKLARNHNKQIIATTHNPCVLDGLDLSDNGQGLIVARRNIDGYTIINSVAIKGELSMPLSEAWTKGYIGGLPDNF